MPVKVRVSIYLKHDIKGIVRIHTQKVKVGFLVKSHVLDVKWIALNFNLMSVSESILLMLMLVSQSLYQYSPSTGYTDLVVKVSLLGF